MRAAAATWLEIATQMHNRRHYCLCLAIAKSRSIAAPEKKRALATVAEAVLKKFPGAKRELDGIVRGGNGLPIALYLWSISDDAGRVARIQFCTDQIRKATR